MPMHAAVVRSFDHPPRYEVYATPVPSGPGQALARVVAAGLHPRVRSGAAGIHYKSTGQLPMIPGIDGVGRLEDGQLVYFSSQDDAWGSLAEWAVVGLPLVVPLPPGADPFKVAAGLNPAMSGWVTLRRRVQLEPGYAVLILGATGSAGGMAVQVAKLLGAARVVAAGRNQERLAELASLGADHVVPLAADPLLGGERLAAAAADVDVVIDYLWGKPAASAMVAIAGARRERSRGLDWVQIGSVAGPTIELPSALLRSANLRIQGAGAGSVSPEQYRSELPALMQEIAAGRIAVDARPVPLAEVEYIWGAAQPAGQRIVLVP